MRCLRQVTVCHEGVGLKHRRLENPLGFQVTSYRVDTDYAPLPPAESEPAAFGPDPFVADSDLSEATHANVGAAATEGASQ